MPFVDKIVAQLNTEIEAELNQNSALQNHILYGIAEPSYVNSEAKPTIQPCVINLDGEGTPVIYDDSYNLSIYHRIFQEPVQAVQGMSFGNKAQDWVRTSTDMEMVVWAHRTKVKMNPRILAGQLFAMIPGTQITVTDTSNNKVGTAVLLVNNTNFDSLSIFGRDYRGSEYFVGEQLMLFGIRYTIESTFRKECFNTCVC